MNTESVTLFVKGVWLVAASGALHVITSVAQTISEPTEIVKLLESLGPNGLLLAGIVFLYKANQRLEQEIRTMREEHRKSNDEHLEMLKKQVEESTESRNRLYEAIKGALAKPETHND